MVAMTVKGAHASSQALGMPDNTILPNQESLSIFDNSQEAATLWYHDRTRGTSSLNNYLGASGLYLIRKPDSHELPNGEHDIPLVLQDRTIDGNGQLVYPDGLETTTTHSLALVNGKVWPYLEVDRGSYRFRIANASGGRTFRLGFSNGLPFTVIGGDLGLLPTSTMTDRVTVAPGERLEVVVDFSGLLPGTEVVLTNDAPAPFPGFENQGVIPEILKVVVGSASAPTIKVASELGSVEPLSPENAAEERTLILGRDTGECSPFAWNINSTNWGDTIIRPRLGTTEVWHIANTTRDMQPIHIDTAFQIFSKSNFEFVNGDVVATNETFPLAPEEAGWKDSVRVGAGEMVSIVLAFDDFEGRLAFHSNILEHADNAMLGQYVVTTTCGDGFAGAPAEQCDDSGASAECNSDCTLARCGDGQVNELAGEVCDDGGLEAGDGCSPACQLEETAETPDGGCGCKATGVPDASTLGGLFLLLIFVVRRRRWS
jgi:spore coat protein A